KYSPIPIGCAALAIFDAVHPRSRENKPSSTAPHNVGSSTMRPAASQAASPEPTATATEKMVRNRVTTPSLPPIRKVTSGGSSDSTMAPTSQNQLTTIAPHHSRGSAHTYLTRPIVEAAMLRLTVSCGAPSPVLGMSRLAPHDASAVTIISQ